ncbi:MAG: hypothetical protein KIT73_01005 [Burkholderiales bacterium]|nr:hypothetical protein [Burkholderiales bacterium]
MSTMRLLMGFGVACALTGPAIGQDTVSRKSAGCENCGVVRAVREIQSQRSVATPDPTDSPAYRNPGSASNLIVGPRIGFTFGSGEREPFVGARGSRRYVDSLQQMTYEVIVRLDDGSFTRIEDPGASDLLVGERVRIRDGRIELVE